MQHTESPWSLGHLRKQVQRGVNNIIDWQELHLLQELQNIVRCFERDDFGGNRCNPVNGPGVKESLK